MIAIILYVNCMEAIEIGRSHEGIEMAHNTTHNRLKAVGLIDRPAPHFVGTTAAAHARAARQVHFDSGWIETPIFDRAELAVGARLSGPAVVDEMSATTLVPTGWDLSVDRSGNLLLEMAV